MERKMYVYDTDLNLVSSGTVEFMSKFVDNFVESGYIVSWVKLDDDPEAIKFYAPKDATIRFLPNPDMTAPSIHTEIRPETPFKVICKDDDCPICELGHKSIWRSWKMPKI